MPNTDKPWRKREWRWSPRGQKLPTLMPSAWQNMPSGWQCLRQRKRNSPQYSQMCFHIAKQMDGINQDIVGENSVGNNAGELALTDEDKAKACVEHYATRLLNVEFVSRLWAPWGPCNCWSPSQCVLDPDPQSTQQNEMQKYCCPMRHRSWDIESCWWGKSWAGETADRGCFKLQCDPIRLAGELHSEPL